MIRLGGMQRRFSHSAGCDPEPISGNELGLASLEANVPRKPGAASWHDGAVFSKTPITTGTAPWLHRLPPPPRGPRPRHDVRPSGPSRSPVRSDSFSPPRSGNKAPGRTCRRVSPRPPLDAAAPDPDLGPDDLMCRLDRCRAVRHRADLLRLGPLPPSASDPASTSRLLRGGATPPPDRLVGHRRRLRRHSTASWPTAWSSTAGPPSGATALA